MTHGAWLGSRATVGCVLALAGGFGCSPEAASPVPETLEARGQPLAELAAPEPPEPPDLGACPAAWTPEGEAEKLRCVPEWSVAPPELLSCPPGWAPGDVGTRQPRSVCLPPAPRSCAADERWDMLSAACVRVGSSCPPAGDFAATPAGASQVLHIRAGAAGDGTAEAPFGSIEAALLAAAPDAVLLLAAGTYATTAEIDLPVRILGACARETRIVGSAAAVPDVEVDEVFQGALHVGDGGRLALENVTLGGARTALTVVAGASARLTDVIVQDFTPMGLWVSGSGSTLEVTRSLFAGGLVAEGNTVAPAINAAFGGHLIVTHSALRDGAGRAIGVLSSASAEVSDVSIFSVRAGAQLTSSPVYASRSEVNLQRSHVADFYGQGVAVIGGAADLSQVVVERGVSSGGNAQTVGLRVEEGGDVSCSACVIRDMQGFGVAVLPAEAGTRIALTDVLVADVRPAADGSGAAVSAKQCDATLTRVEVLDSPGIAIGLEDCAAELTDVRALGDGEVRGDDAGIRASRGSYVFSRVSAEGLPIAVDEAYFDLDAVFVTEWTSLQGALLAGILLEGVGRATRLHAARSFGIGVVFKPGRIEADGVVVEDLKPLLTQGYDIAVGVALATGAEVQGTHWVTRNISGVGISSAGGLALSDARVVDSVERRDGDLGGGLMLQGDNTLARLEIERAFGVGILASGGKLSIEDVTLRDVLSGRVGGRYGYGLAALSSEVDGSRLRIERAHTAGVFGVDSAVSLRDLSVEDVQASTGLGDGGMGLWFSGPRPIHLERVLVVDVFGAGLGATQSAEVTAQDLYIRSVAEGKGLLEDVFGVQVADGLADCVLGAERSTLRLVSARLEECARSGLLLHRASAALEAVDLRNLPVGVVAQYAALPEHEPSTLYFEGIAQPLLTNPGFPIPSGPPVIGGGDTGEFGNLIREVE